MPQSTQPHPLMGLSLQDAPKDCESPVVVTSYKPGQGGCCLRCHYIHRGSFKNLSLNALETQLSEHAPLREKCFGFNFPQACYKCCMVGDATDATNSQPDIHWPCSCCLDDKSKGRKFLSSTPKILINSGTLSKRHLDHKSSTSGKYWYFPNFEFWLHWTVPWTSSTCTSASMSQYESNEKINSSTKGMASIWRDYGE